MNTVETRLKNVMKVRTRAVAAASALNQQSVGARRPSGVSFTCKLLPRLLRLLRPYWIVAPRDRLPVTGVG